jgi:hypothetical protein
VVNYGGGGMFGSVTVDHRLVGVWERFGEGSNKRHFGQGCKRCPIYNAK